MDITRKIDRIKAEIDYLAQGAGTLAEKQAAFAEIQAHADAQLAAVPPDEPPPQE